MRNFVYVVTDVDKKSPNASESLILSMLPLKADWAEEFPIGKCCRKDFEEIFRGCVSDIKKKEDGFDITLDVGMLASPTPKGVGPWNGSPFRKLFPES